MSVSSFVFVESNTTGTGRLFARAARELGFVPLLLAVDPGRYPFAREDAVRVEQVDTSSVEAIIAHVRRRMAGDGVAGVCSSSEYFAAAAAAVAQALDRPHADAACLRRAQDKIEQYACLSRAGVSVPPFVPVRDPEAAETAVAALDPPFVIKPHRGSGSLGVRRCDTRPDALAHVRQLLAQRENERGAPIDPAALVTAYVGGAEYSVELFSGEPIGCTRKHLSPEPLFVEIGHDFPAPLTGVDRDALETTAREAARALGLMWGPVHVELRLTPDGPVIIEVNARLAGGFIPELVRVAAGQDLIRATIALAGGLPVDLRRTCHEAAAIRFARAERSGILEIDTSRAAVLPGLIETRWYRASGDRVDPQGDFRDRVGHVLAAGATAPVAAARADAALAACAWRVRQAEPTAIAR
jgi:biotin carboxylase